MRFLLMTSLLLQMLVASLIPAGWMLDEAALASGQIRLVLCGGRTTADKQAALDFIHGSELAQYLAADHAAADMPDEATADGGICTLNASDLTLDIPTPLPAKVQISAFEAQRLAAFAVRRKILQNIGRDPPFLS